MIPPGRAWEILLWTNPFFLALDNDEQAYLIALLVQRPAHLRALAVQRLFERMGWR